MCFPAALGIFCVIGIFSLSPDRVTKGSKYAIFEMHLCLFALSNLIRAGEVILLFVKSYVLERFS